MASNSTDDINKSMNEKVVDPTTIPLPMKAIKELALEMDMIYLQADAYIGNPYALLGCVLEIRKTTDGNPLPSDPLPGKLFFSPSVIPGTKVDETSKIKEPIKRGSIVADQKLSIGVSFLNYLSTQFESDTTYSLMVFDQMAGLAERHDGTWDDGMDKWKLRNKELIESADVLAIYAVIGFVQKYIIRRKFKKFKLGAKGGFAGLNINGELYTGNEDFSLDIRYGLQTVAIKHLPSSDKQHSKGLGFSSRDNTETLSLHETSILNDLTIRSNFQIPASELGNTH